MINYYSEFDLLMKKELILIEYDKTIQEAMEKIIFNKTRTIFVLKIIKF